MDNMNTSLSRPRTSGESGQTKGIEGSPVIGAQYLNLLRDKHAVVTGASSGIGKAIAEAFTTAGAEVLGLDVVGQDPNHTSHQNASGHGQFEYKQVDVTVPKDVEDALSGRRIDVLVNAAGIIVRKGLLDTSHEEWRQVIDVNLTGYFTLIKSALPALRQAANGTSIIQIASISAHTGYGYPAYTASKGGVLSLTRQLASELAALGVRINSISPGVTRTGINQDTLGQEAIRQATESATPLKRLGEPRDIASVALFLASDLAGFITGEDIIVDGGLSSYINWGAAADALWNAHTDKT